MKKLRAILALPFMVLVIMPGLILYFGGFRLPAIGGGRLYAAAAVGLLGATLLGWTIRLLHKKGEGTLAPWDPTRKLVVAGPYAYVRNPMISGVLLLLLAETLFFPASGLPVWLALFALVNMIYFPLSEEPGLRRRFGAEYEEYCRHVPRWLPRPTPWRPPADRDVQ